MNTNNTIPERMSEPIPISIEMTNAPDRPLSDLSEHPPRIYNKNNQGENPDGKVIYL
jgi:hypothetical protein